VLFDAPPPAVDTSRQVIDERNAFIMNSLLQEVTRTGTAARVQATLKRPDLYGKTGTTNDSMDAWFVGYHPTLVATVWVGYDTPRNLGSRETGGGLSLPIWIDYMAEVLKGVPVAEYKPPSGVIRVGGDWYYEEFGPGQGVHGLGLRDPWPGRPVESDSTPEEMARPPNDTEEDRRTILDLFRN
jgi:penicillin-binding protein 1A